MKYIDGLTKRQKRFIDLFSSLFNTRDAHGKIKPFHPEPFQQEFLKDSMLCNKVYKNRIVNKGRGTGLTSLIAGEILIAARIMEKIKIPITSISARTANVLLNWCIDLADSSNVIKISEGDFTINRDMTISSICKLKNGSQIIPISGGSPESIRSLRAPILILDEFAFADYQKAILTAGERCLSEGGQITIISTPRTSDVINDEYWRIWMHAEEMGYKKYSFPIFDPTKLNVNRPLTEQNLIPIAPWIDINGLENDRKRDVLMFSRENLCVKSNTNIIMKDYKLKEIKDIKINDIVLGDTGFTKVKEILKRNHNGDIYKIRLIGNKNLLEITEGHPIFAIKTSKKCSQYKFCWNRNCNFDIRYNKNYNCNNKKCNEYKPEWIKPENLEKNDIVLLPILKENNNKIKIDILDYINNNKIINDCSDILFWKNKYDKKNHIYPRYININNDFIKIISYYITEGWTENRLNAIKISIATSKKEEIDNLEQSFINLNLKNFITRKESKNYNNTITYTISCCNRIFSLFMQQICGVGSFNKMIPDFIFNINKDQQKTFIRYLIDGDGYIGKYNNVIYCSMSKNLLNQLRFLLLQNNIRGIFNGNNYEFLVNNLNSNFEHIKNKNENLKVIRHNNTYIYENYYAMPIKEIIKEHYVGEVYNLETESNTYSTHQCIVHNCSPMDESVAFLSWELVKKCCILTKYSPLIENTPVYVGIDVGRTQDKTAIEGFQCVDGKYYHVFEKIMSGIDIPTQVKEIFEIDKKYNCHTINIDKTGIGLGLYEYARKEIGGKVHGITFTKESKTSMAVNLRNLMQDEKVFMIKNNDFMDDIHSLPYNSLDASRTELGHADRFWGTAMSIMKPKFKITDAGKMLDSFI